MVLAKVAKGGAMELEDYHRGLDAGDRRVLAKAITLIESQRPEDQFQARALHPRTTITVAPCA